MNENCTVGAVLAESGLILFKNRDLYRNVKDVPGPKVVSSGDGLVANAVDDKEEIKRIIDYVEVDIGEKNEGKSTDGGLSQSQQNYIKFDVDFDGVDKRLGVWAGINESGLGVVGADGNSTANYSWKYTAGGKYTWKAYEHVIANFSSVESAFPWLINYYDITKVGGSGDIILMADPECALVMEYLTPGNWGLQFLRKDRPEDENFPPYILRTNYFILLGKYRRYPEHSPIDRSSAKRYECAFPYLAKHGDKITVDHVKTILKSHDNGQNTFSTCRHSDNEYNTMASVIMHVPQKGKKVEAHYILNSRPCEKDEYQVIELNRR